MFCWSTVQFFVGLLVVFGAEAVPVNEEELSFEVNGIQHYEKRTVSDNIVTLTDIQDEFIITLDYGRDILLINNLKNSACYFARLENLPINKDDKTPVLFVGDNKEFRQKEVDVVFNLGGSIPSDYVTLTNDITVAEQCSSKPSYWLNVRDGARKRRADNCFWGICKICLCTTPGCSC